jgi:RND family efflux transporter MFP subunit
LLPDLPTFEVEAGAGVPGRGWDGVVEAVRRSDLSAQTAGRVTAIEVDVNDRVAAGAVLLRISAVEQQAGANTARAQLRAAEASAVEAEHTWRRYVALGDKHYVSKLQLDQVRAARDAAIAAREAARAQLAQAEQQSAYTVVHAPFAGIVAAREVEPGETVAPGQPLMSVYAPGELRIEVLVPQSRAEAIRRDPRATVLLPGGREVVPSDVIVFPAADPISHSVNVRVLLPVQDPLPTPGTTAKVVFAAEVGMAEDATAWLVRIPASAVAQRGELNGVYVKHDDRITLRQVRIGARAGDRVEVISGLRPGEQIVRDPVAAVQALVAQRKAAEGAHD